MSKTKRLDRLPVFPSPPAPADPSRWSVRIGGWVEAPLVLTYDQICRMPAAELTADFRCEEGWEVRGLRWTGVPVAHLIKLAGPSEEARYVAVGSGDFVAVLPLLAIEGKRALLAYLLDGAPLS